MFGFFKRPAVEKAPQAHEKRESWWSTHAVDIPSNRRSADSILAEVRGMLPKAASEGAQDASDDGVMAAKMYGGNRGALSDALASWYGSQGFIGHQMCAILAQNWLINKACSMPARDAIRNGYDIVTEDGEDLPDEAAKILKRSDKKFKVKQNLEQFLRFGRIFGVRIALFKVDSTDPDWYENPFNIDGVQAGQYKGIVQVDPYWVAPELDSLSAVAPDSAHFYEPVYWRINGRRYHRSHLIIYRHDEVADILKPAYLYGGVPVPQQIMERVYGAERTANEAPQLAQSKRTTVWLTDMETVAANPAGAMARLAEWATYRDNYAVKMGDKDGDSLEQFDTSLGDLDTVIMTQYQIVAAAANVPATKLLGTSPKGFSSTGEFESKSYHEELESIQEHDCTPFVERHHALVWKSEIEPTLGLEPIGTTVNWRPVDSPSAKEIAELNKLKADTDMTLSQVGSIDGSDSRKRIATDPQSGYHGAGTESEDDGVSDLLNEIEQALSNGGEESTV